MTAIEPDNQMGAETTRRRLCRHERWWPMKGLQNAMRHAGRVQWQKLFGVVCDLFGGDVAWGPQSGIG
jgi:hypothetical protein